MVPCGCLPARGQPIRTPTAPTLLCHAGDLEGAARVADAARRMDLADRYLNCTAVKALLRAGHVSVPTMGRVQGGG